MTNADKFKEIFGLYATELWAKPEKEFLGWLNEEVPEITVGDTISRQAAIDAICKSCNGQFSCEPSDCWFINSVKNLPSAQQWIPVKYRPMDEEERQYWEETYGRLEDDEAVMFDCKMPQDGQEVWVCSKCGDVLQDTCQSDEEIYLENNPYWLDIVAWMPFIKPEPFKGAEDVGNQK